MRKPARLFVFSVALWTASPAWLGAQGTVSNVTRRIENVQTPSRQGLDPFTLQEIMDKYGVPGLSVAVIWDFEIHWAKGYGVADVETGAKVNTDTLFQAASIGKPVAAMAVLKAVEDGRFGLDDDIKSDGESNPQDRPTGKGPDQHWAEPAAGETKITGCYACV